MSPMQVVAGCLLVLVTPEMLAAYRRAFDFHLGLVNPRRLASSQATRLHRHYERYAAGFRRLALARMRFVVTSLAETGEAA